MWWLVAIFLTLVLVMVIATHKQPSTLVEVKSRYEKLRVHLQTLDDPRWKKLTSVPIITGMIDWDKKKGPIGYNVNKGYEIGICLAGDDANSAFYVLIHELAHITVSEYDHSTDFWKNFKDLKDICVGLGLYDPNGATTYCGELIVR